MCSCGGGACVIVVGVVCVIVVGVACVIAVESTSECVADKTANEDGGCECEYWSQVLLLALLKLMVRYTFLLCTWYSHRLQYQCKRKVGI